MKVKNDHRSKFSNLSNWKEEAWKQYIYIAKKNISEMSRRLPEKRESLDSLTTREINSKLS